MRERPRDYEVSVVRCGQNEREAKPVLLWWPSVIGGAAPHESACAFVDAVGKGPVAGAQPRESATD